MNSHTVVGKVQGPGPAHVLNGPCVLATTDARRPSLALLSNATGATASATQATMPAITTPRATARLPSQRSFMFISVPPFRPQRGPALHTRATLSKGGQVPLKRGQPDQNEALRLAG